MTTPLIDSGEEVALVAVLVALLTAALAAERTRLRDWIPGPAIMLIGGAALSNLGVVPREAAAFKELASVVVPVGVFLLLLRANIAQILRETGFVLRHYLVGAATSIVGILLAYLTVPLVEASKVAATQTAALVGGTVNLIAVAQAVELSPTTFSAVYVGSAPIMVGYLALTGILARNQTLLRLFPRRTAESAEPALAGPTDSPATTPTLSALNLAATIASAIIAYAVCDMVMRRFGLEQYVVVAITVVALVVANFLPRAVGRCAGDRELGTMLMYLFFGTLGVGINLAQFGPSAVLNAAFLGIAVAVHLVLLFAIALLTRGDLVEVLVGSIAGISGPTTAAAMAASFDRRDLITPGILCGLLGFATATFVGIALFAALGS